MSAGELAFRDENLEKPRRYALSSGRAESRVSQGTHALCRARLRPTKPPSAPKPSAIKVQVAGSGTALTVPTWRRSAPPQLSHMVRVREAMAGHRGWRSALGGPCNLRARSLASCQPRRTRPACFKRRGFENGSGRNRPEESPSSSGLGGSAKTPREKRWLGP
jgi:hypothetical protein